MNKEMKFLTWNMRAILLIAYLFVAIMCPLVNAGQCDQANPCGVNSQCLNQTCYCKDGYTLQANVKECVSSNCSSPDCVLCSDQVCRRCVYFIDKETRVCLYTCTGKAEMIYTGEILGSVCTRRDDPPELSDMIIGIIAGVSAGIFLCILVGLCLFFHLKQKRGRVNLQRRRSHFSTPTMETGKLHKIPVYDNRGFVAAPEPAAPPGVSNNRTAYMEEVERMKPSAQMLLDLLNQIRKRVRAMDDDDARIPTYKGVIHQLCRVLVMLNKKDPGTSVPADGRSLLDWAKQMLQDYVETRQSLEDEVDPDTEDSRYGKFPSTVASPETASTSLSSDNIAHTVYATPVDHMVRGENSGNSLNSVWGQPVSPVTASIGHYHSAPVPYLENRAHIRPGRTIPVSSPTVPVENSGDSGTSNGVRSGYRHYTDTPRTLATGQNPLSTLKSKDANDNPEIYAPASSYSEYAQPKVSTFSGGVPRSLSTDSGSDYMDSDDEPNPDGFPFDPEEATEPIEV